MQWPYANEQRTTEWTGGHHDEKITFYVFFIDQYLINYTTKHITTKPVQKIESQVSIHLLNYNHISTEITIKTSGRQGKSEF